MQSICRSWCRQSLCTVNQRALRSQRARNFHPSSIKSNNEGPGASREASPSLNDAYLNVEVESDKKIVKTAVGELPLSPLMDPAFHEARLRFTKAKPARTEYKLTKFQRHLRRNPYARALATPVRRCPITSVALPNFFLQRFSLIAHPETKAPWFVPQDLETRAPVKPPAAEAQRPDAIQGGREAADGPSPEATHESPEDGGETGQKADGPTPGTRNLQKQGPSAYTLSSQSLLQELQRNKSPYFALYRKLLRMSDHGITKLGSLISMATWRSDMDAVVLELLRRRVVEGLCHFSNMTETAGREYVVKCESWDDAKNLKHRGCLLYLGPPEGSSSGSTPGDVPPRLSVMDMGPVKFGAKLAVHSLPELLGEEHVSRLRRESALLRDGSLYLLARQATVNLQMMLWKLQGYMAWNRRQESTPNEDDSKEQT
ncbi:hypothetical protein VTH06DRAFT_6699 [Thermothelomyces fergusii]